MKIYSNAKPNFIDLILDAAISYYIAKDYGIAVGCFTFGVMVTLNQIFWVICEGIRKIPVEINVTTKPNIRIVVPGENLDHGKP